MDWLDFASKAFLNVLSWLISIFPDDPLIEKLMDTLSTPEMINIIRHINYFIPLGTLSKITVAFMGALISVCVASKVRRALGR